MRFFLSAILFLSVNSFLVAQDDAQDEYYAMAAEVVCACYDATKTPSLSPQSALGTCIMRFLSENMDAYEAVFGPMDLSNQVEMRKLGETIGLKMATVCPESLMEIGVNATDEQGDEIQRESEAPVSFASGTITAVKGEEVAIVSLRSLEGKPLKFYWLEYFPGSEVLTDAKNRSKLPVEIEYVSRDIYDPAQQEYISRRVIRAIRVLE